MGIFGWSYPPGCNGTPFDEDHPCDVCHKLEDDCICTECPKCGQTGWLKCYDSKDGCGLVLSPDQINLRAQFDQAMREEAERERQQAEQEIQERGLGLDG